MDVLGGERPYQDLLQVNEFASFFVNPTPTLFQASFLRMETPPALNLHPSCVPQATV